MSLVTVLAGSPVACRIKSKCLSLAYKVLHHLAPASEVPPLSSHLWPQKHLSLPERLKPSHLHKLLPHSNSNYASNSILRDPVRYHHLWSHSRFPGKPVPWFPWHLAQTPPLTFSVPWCPPTLLFHEAF